MRWSWDTRGCSGQRFLNEFRFNYAQQHQYQSPSGVPYYKKFDFSPERFVGDDADLQLPELHVGQRQLLPASRR